MRAEYDFDYRGKTNWFAGRVGKTASVVVLDTDVSKVFSTSKSVNTALLSSRHAVEGQQLNNGH